jgi:uncharacterized protein
LSGEKILRRLGTPLAALLLGLVNLYRLLLSPYLGGRCRFHPSCSQYALDALTRFGALRGSALSALRVLRCNPLCEGGFDPIPADGALRWGRSPHAPQQPAATETPAR